MSVASVARDMMRSRCQGREFDKRSLSTSSRLGSACSQNLRAMIRNRVRDVPMKGAMVSRKPEPDMALRTREPAITSEWLSPADAAEQLGVSVRKLQYMAREGEIERRKQGRRSMYRVRFESSATPAPPRATASAAVGRTPQDTPSEGVEAVPAADATPSRISAGVDAADAIRAAVPIITMESDAVEDGPDGVDVRFEQLEARVELQLAALRRDVTARLDQLEARLARSSARPRVNTPSGAFGAATSTPWNSAAYDDTEPARPPGGHFESPFHAALEQASRQARQANIDDPDVLHAMVSRTLAERRDQQTPGLIRIAREAVGWFGSIFAWLTGRRR